MPGKTRKLRWMELAFKHNEENNALLMEVGTHAPELKDYAKQIVTHFDSKGSDLYVQSKQKFAALAFLTSKNYETAAERVKVKLGLIYESAQKMLLETLNDGPQGWLADEPFFEGRGLIRGTSKYYVRHHDLEVDSDFQQFRSRVQPHLLPILSAGIDCVFSTKAGFGLKIQPRVLSYIAAQLMPESDHKASVFESLRQRDASGTGYNLAVIRSVLAIEKISKTLGIDIKGIELVTIPVPVKRPSASKLASQLNEAANPAPKQVDKELTLSAQFNFLKHRGDVTPVEASAYLLIQQKKEAGRVPSAMEIQSLLSRGSARVSLADAAAFEKRIEQHLEVLRKDIGNNPLRFQSR